MRFVTADTETPSLSAARPKCRDSVTAIKLSTAVKSRFMRAIVPLGGSDSAPVRRAGLTHAAVRALAGQAFHAR